MPTVSIYLDTRASGQGEAPLKASINCNSRTAMIPLGVRLLPSQWDSKNKTVVKHPNRKYLNMFISGRKLAIEAEILKLSELGRLKGLSAIQIRDAVEVELDPEKRMKMDKEHSFLYRFEQFMALNKKQRTEECYGWTLTWLKRYDPSLQVRMFEDITTDYIKRFISFASALKPNSVNILLRNIRAVFNDAIDAGITNSYPFRRISIKPAQTKKKALSEHQIRTLFSCPCEPWQEEYRDMFKLMFFLRGINAIDLFSASLSQIVNGRLEYRRSKVGTLFSVKIEPEAWEIIGRYRGKDHLLSPLDRYANYKDYLHRMNNGLKSIGRPTGKRGTVLGAGLFPGLSSNWARHSWATIAAELDIPDPTITLGMGHSSAGHRTTAIYIKRDDRKVDEANRKIMDYVLHPNLQTTSASSLAESPAIYAGVSPSRSTPSSEAIATAR